MSDDNNNADFDAALSAVSMRPAPDLTREEFLRRLETLAEEMRDDHEASTGVTETELHDWDFWMGELTNAYVNSD